ncbi:MAG: sigma-54-dependent Fis family transcriptional regulator [Deltaproteobacteria bacterium]|nr:sigma-54-dependent Fis family transcriptional regulator [Deltaproteobacteria bacterium]
MIDLVMTHDERSAHAHPLGCLLPRREELFDAWYAQYREAAGEHARLVRQEMGALFGRELERVMCAEAASNPEVLRAVLRATASCLARRAVPLADLLAVTTTASEAARAVLGPVMSREVADASDALERERVRAYAEAYRGREDPMPRSCRRKLPAAPEPSRAPQPPDDGWGIIGTSPAVQRLLELISAAASGPQSVLVTGESGTGKELVARAIHTAAGGDRARFVAVNCAALPTSLIESELFGHARGAFTGAASDAPGLFRSAHGGTLFLDEITEMAAEMQAKLLRVLEERTVRAVGSLQEVAIDVRVVASTNRDPQAAMSQGKLRADLFYRLASMTIHVPALRQRRSDIPLLVEHFLSSFCHRRCGCISGVSRAAMDALVAAEWPGNVRQLRNAVEHAVTTGRNGLIELEDLPSSVRDALSAPAARPLPANAGLASNDDAEVPSLAEIEARTIRAALSACAGNKVHAARMLGISRHKLYDRLRVLQLAGDAPDGTIAGTSLDPFEPGRARLPR